MKGQASSQFTHFGDDQVADVHLVGEEVPDSGSDEISSLLRVPLLQDYVQALGDDVPHETAIVPPHRLDPLAVHLVVPFRVGPKQRCVPLLVHEKVGVVNLFKLELDGPHEERVDVVRRLHRSAHHVLQHVVIRRKVAPGHAETDHHGIRVPVDHLCIVLEPIRDRVPGLHLLLGELDHLPPKGSHAG